MVIHQVISKKGSSMLIKSLFHKELLLKILQMHLLIVLLLRHSVSSCLLFSILELIKVRIIMLHLLVQVEVSLV